MDPIFFPLTYMSDTDMGVMRACFQQFAACQPSGLSVPEAMTTLAREGCLDICVPVQIDEKRLRTVLKEYRAWTDLHQSGGLSYLKTLGDTVPFFDETALSKICSDIRQGGGGEPSDSETDSLFKAAVFLQIAQELDRENADVRRDLDRLRRKERNLFESLHGEGEGDVTREPEDGVSSGTEDPGAYMTAERVAAWSRLMSGNLASSGLFVTTSRAVFDFILDRVEDGARILSLNAVAVSSGVGEEGEHWRHSLQTALEKLVSETSTTDLTETTTDFPETRQESGLSLSIRMIAGESPAQFFTRFIARGRKSGNRVLLPGKYQNTLVAYLGFGSG